MTKLVGFFVVFACLPLAALSLTVSEYAAFNFSMAVTSLMSIVFGPMGSAFVVRFAHFALRDQSALREVAEDALAIFLSLGAILALPAFLVAYWLSPSPFRIDIGLAAIAVIATATLSWAEIFRLGIRQDHISSAFALANNLTIIAGFAILYRWSNLTFEHVLYLYYFSPLVWGLASFAQLMSSARIRTRIELSPHKWADAISCARPNIINSASDYIKLYGSSFVAFYLSTPQSYATFSTLQLLIARLINPLSLIARPLIPAYVDAVVRNDVHWIGRLKKSFSIQCALTVIGVLLTIVVLSTKSQQNMRLGAVVINGHELIWYSGAGVLLFGFTVSLALLASIYLAGHKMELFSKVCFLSNAIAVVVGGLATVQLGPIAMLAAIAIGSALAALYLTWLFVSGSLSNKSVQS